MLTAVLVLCALIVLLQLVYLGLFGFQVWRTEKAMKSISAANHAMTQATSGLVKAQAEMLMILAKLPTIADGMEQAKEAVLCLPSLVNGLIKATKAHATVVMDQKRDQQAFRSLMFGDQVDAASQPTLDDEAEEWLAKVPGMGMDEARDRAKEASRLKDFRVTQ